MKTIGVIGTGFVGTAMIEGLRHAFDVLGYDKKLGWQIAGSTFVNQFQADNESPFLYMLENVTGPIFVCVPTPMNPDGSCNTSIVESVVLELDKVADGMERHRLHRPVVCIKSTVPPGTTQKLNDQCKEVIVCFNPEFLTERSAVKDFQNQSRIIVGGPREGTSILKMMYDKAYPDVPLTKTGSSVAEMVKYTTNVFLAVKVALANELNQLCEQLDDVDFDKVVEYATKDPRLGSSHWAVPGPDGKYGFGGSCFPKDLNALKSVATKLGVSPKMMDAAWEKNLEVRPEKDWEELKGRAVNG